MNRLDRASVVHYLAKLESYLSPKDLQRIRDVAGLLDDNTLRVRVVQVLQTAYAATENADAHLRELLRRVNAAAKEAGIRFALKVSPERKASAHRRWVWFEGDNLLAERAVAFSRAETAELDRLPTIAGQQGQPLGETRDGKPLVRWFLSYAREDAKEKARLLTLLQKRLATRKNYAFERWQDQDIIAGEQWRTEIHQALEQCSFGLLLVSHAFLTSDFIGKEELPYFVNPDPKRPGRKRAIPLCLENLGDINRIDLKGLENQQIFRDDEGKAFDERRSPKDKSWVNQLVDQIERMLDKYGMPAASPQAAPLPRSLLCDLSDAEAWLVRDARGVPATLEKEKAEDIGADHGEAVDALQHLLTWVGEPAAPPLFALLGEYGMGKTITCQRLARALEDARQRDPKQPPPIYLDLRHLTGLEKGVPLLQEIVAECLARGTRGADEGMSFQQVATLFRNGAVIIYDGLDEALVHLSEHHGQAFTRELLKFLPPPKENGSCGKILISCRTHYFRSLREQQNHFTGQERGAVQSRDYRAMLLLPFTPEQVSDYLQKALPDVDVEQLQETIRSVHNLTELTQRPYTLRLVSGFIPQIERWRAEGRRVNGVTLYRQLVLSWLERDSGKHQLKPDHKERLMPHLAASLWRSRRRVFPVQELENWFHGWLDQQEDLRLRYRDMDKDKLEEDLRTATFLVRADDADDPGFRFAHSSVQEYFLAVYLLGALRGDRRQDWTMPAPSPETLDFLGQLLDEAGDGQLLQRLSAWRRPYFAEASETWLAYALRAHRRNWPAPVLRGADLTGARLRGCRFEGTAAQVLDLTGSTFAGADLREAYFQHTELGQTAFTGSRLAGAEFHRSSLRATHFDQAQMQGVIFRESNLLQTTWQGTKTYRTQILLCADIPVKDQLPEALFAPLVEPVAHLPSRRLEISTGHRFMARFCAFSPDGTRLLSAGEDGTLRLWDTETGEGLRVYSGHQGSVGSCAFSPDGTRLLSAGEDGTLRLWDTETGEALRVYSGHQGSVESCAFSPDGARLLSAGEDGTLRLWDTATAEELRVFSEHHAGVWSCAFSPDGARLLSAGGDGTLRLWDTASAKELRVFSGHHGGVWSCVFFPDGAWLLSAGEDGTLRLWDTASAKELRVFSGHHGGVWSCAFSPDGARLLSAGDDGTLRLWDTATGEALRVYSGHQGSVGSCTFSPDGARLLSAGRDGALRLWDMETGEELRVYSGHRGSMGSCAFSSDGARLLSAGQDGALRLWDTETGKESQVFPGHQGWVWSCAFSPDGARLLSAGQDGALRLWDTETGKESRVFPGHQGWVWSCAFSPDGARLLSAGQDGALRLWDTETGEESRVYSGHQGSVWSCAFSPDGARLLSAGQDGTLRLWDTETGEELRVYSGHPGGVSSCAISPDGARLLSAGFDGTMRLWDTETGENLRVHAVLGNGHAVWTPRNSLLVEAAGDAWRWLAWLVVDEKGAVARLPLETFGPMPKPKSLAKPAGTN